MSRVIYVRGGHGFECPPGSTEVSSRGQLKHAVFVVARPGTKGCVYSSDDVCSVAAYRQHRLSPTGGQQRVTSNYGQTTTGN